MKRVHHIIHLTALLVFAIIANDTFAGIETYNARLLGSNIYPNVQLHVRDNKYSNMLANASWADHYTNYKVKNRIVLGIDPTIPVTSSLIQRCISLTITHQNPGGTPVTFTKELTISYSSDLNDNYENKVVYEFYGGQDLKVKINSIKDCATVPNVATVLPNMYIQTEVEVERYYKLYKPTIGTETITVNKTAIDLDAGGIKDELDIYWNYIEGAEEFDLEWTYANDVDANGYYGASAGLGLSSINYDFKNNATRVTIKENHYTIPLIFETGYIVYRVRGVGRGGSDFTKRINGDWSIAESGTLGSLAAIDFYPTTTTEINHEQNKNWQYIANFAEDGKRKESISYFDGSLRNRQSVSKLNTQNQTIVGQKIYDYQGRPAIEVLPTPTDSSVIKFYETYNHNSLDAEFTKVDFDKDVASCVTDPASMKPTAGSSKYYSPYNPNLLNENGYIADADSFPYSQIEYTPDNTGRIRKQGGVGKEFQIGKNHETKYFYGQPTTQQEMDRLFGSEAGDKGHYKKNMVVDANGQVSVSYVNLFGKTIATLLAGNPNNTSTIFDELTDEDDNSIYGINAVDADLLNKLYTYDTDTDIDDNHLSLDGKSLVYSQEILVDNKQKYDFSYTLNDVDYTDACMLTSSCFDCVYDLTIDLVDECGVSVPPFPQIITKGNTTTDDNSCTGEDFSETWGNPGLTNLKTIDVVPVGQYTLTKTLTVNQAALDHYKSIYIENLRTTGESPCFVDSTDIFDEQVIVGPCDDITCQDCKDAIPSIGDYILDMLGGSTPYNSSNYTQAQLDQAEFERNVMLAECDQFCDSYKSICEIRLKQMKIDVSPGNQYGKTINLANNWLSVFNLDNRLPKNIGASVNSFDGNADWRHPTDMIGTSSGIHYLDASGNNYKVLVYESPISPFTTTPAISVGIRDKGDIGAGPNTGWVYPEELANVSDFLKIWEPQWADNLVFYHPEFGYYRSCDELGGVNACTYTFNSVAYTSDQFDSLVYESNTYADIITNLGLSDTSASSSVMTHITLRDKDPYYKSTTCDDILSDDRTNLDNELTNFNGTIYTAAEIAAMTVQCGNNFNSTVPSGCTTILTSPGYLLKNKYWSQLKNYYLATKQKVQAIRADRIALEGSCYSGCIGNNSYNVFPDHIEMLYKTASLTNYPTSPNNTSFSGLVVDFTTSHFINVNTTFWRSTPAPSVPLYPLTAGPYVLPWSGLEQQVDPCSFYWMNLYKGKNRIWGTPDDYLSGSASVYDPQAYLNEQQNNYEYQSYIATGNCPLTIQLEGLLNAIAVNGDLNATNKLFFDASVPTMNYPEFTQDLFTELGGVTSLNNDFRFTGSDPSPYNVLTIAFGTAGTQTLTTCPSVGTNNVVLTFTTPNPDAYSFSNGTHPIVGFTKMSATTAGNFDIYAVIDSNTTGTLVLHKLTGTTCIDIDGCSFDDPCYPTTEVNDLAILMSTLLNNGTGPDFFNTSPTTYLASGGAYESIITNSLLSYMGGTYTNNVSWYKNTTTDYRLAVSGTDKITVVLAAAIPTTTIGVLSILPNPDFTGNGGAESQNVIITYDDGVSTPPANIKTVKALIKAGSDDTFIGNCAAPLPYNCNTDEHQATIDLGAFISELSAAGDFFSTNAVNISTYSSLTPLLKIQTGLTGAYDFEWKYDATNKKGEFIRVLNADLDFEVVCEMPINILYKDPGYSQSEASLLNSLVVDETNTSSFGANKFTITLEDNTTPNIGEAIYVCETTCLALANCYPCAEGETAVELVPNGGLEDYGDYGSKPSGSGQWDRADDVTNVTEATPDYLFNDGTSYDLDQTTCTTGEGMIGLITYDSEDGTANTREYAQIKLDASLLPSGMVKDHVYNVSYTVKLATHGAIPATYDAIIPTNGIGAYFSDGELGLSPSITHYEVLKASDINHAPDNMALNGIVISDSINCTTINFKYKAKGGEDHLVIGSFLDDDEITKITPSTGTKFVGYYLIDSISVMVEGCGAPIVAWPVYDYVDPCEEFMEDVANGNGDMIYKQMVDGLIEDFENNYIAHCMSNAVETFNILYDDGDYHYTLYYYDQAGNLTRTIPPKGVELLPAVDIANAKAYRITQTGTFVPTKHTMQTTYKYNTLNQLIQQTTPDAGISMFWYDALGRLVLSKNAKQAAETNDVYSYTIYDALGRIIEVGEIEYTGEIILASNGFISNAQLNTILGGTRTEVTSTYYDTYLSNIINVWFNLNSSNINGQENLRNRVSSVTYEDIYDSDSLTYDNATHYSYDVHGNVKTLLQDVPKYALYNQRFKRIHYEYDLVSGNVLKVSYQPNYSDQYFHKYEYDADNRITNVYTSRDNVIWDQDAKYFYYLHGPLARTEIGHNKVQTTDYAYTIQGWLKGVNSNTLNVTRDIGKDGRLINGNNNRYIARDAYSYSLGYYDNTTIGDDYKAIGGSTGTTSDFLASIPTGTGLHSFDRNLYNGNIKHMVTTITDLENNSLQPMPQATAYHYDQLNRITGMEAFSGIDYNVALGGYDLKHLSFTNNAWDGLTPVDARYEIDDISYDQNGNIYHLGRNGQSGNLIMDDLEYYYYGSDGISYGASGITSGLPSGVTFTNKLSYVDDKETSSTYNTDIATGQSAGNYRYDEIGNLIADESEDIGDASNVGITWTVYGKIKDILRQTNGNQDLEFVYDANGNRILKAVKDRASGSVLDEDDWVNYIYRLDASGNQMVIYRQEFDFVSGNQYKSTITVENIPIYGSSRIGLDDKDVTFISNFLGQFNADGEFEPYSSGGTVNVSLTSPMRIISDSVTTVTGLTDSEYCLYATENVNAKVTSGVITLNSGSPEVIGDDEINILAGTEVCFSADGDINFTTTSEYEISANRTINVSAQGPITYTDLINLNGKTFNHTIGVKAYEFSNHLGNVLTVVSDKRDFVEQDPENSLIESSFEGGDFHLFESGDYTSLQTTTYAYTYTNSVKTSLITDEIEIRVPVTSGDVVDASVYAYKTSAGTSGNFTFGILDLNTNTWAVGTTPYTENTTATSSWTWLDYLSYTVPSLASNNLVAVIKLTQPAGRIDTYWDEIVLDVDHDNNPDVYYVADVKSVSDYYPFGSLMPNRHIVQTSSDYDANGNKVYRYGFQGQETDFEVKNVTGGSVNYKYRMYDPRIGRFFATDPLAAKYAYNSPYAFSENRVVDAIELEGLEKYFVTDFVNSSGQIYKTVIRIVGAAAIEFSSSGMQNIMVYRSTVNFDGSGNATVSYAGSSVANVQFGVRNDGSMGIFRNNPAAFGGNTNEASLACERAYTNTATGEGTYVGPSDDSKSFVKIIIPTTGNPVVRSLGDKRTLDYPGVTAPDPANSVYVSDNINAVPKNISNLGTPTYFSSLLNPGAQGESTNVVKTNQPSESDYNNGVGTGVYSLTINTTP